MKTLYIEDVASHGGPESCVGDPRGRSEAWTGVRVGRVIEPIFGKRRTTGMREGNERVLHRRPSESRWPRVMRWRPARAQRSVHRGARRPAIEPRNGSYLGVPTRSKTSEGNTAGGVIASRQRTPRGLRTRACVRALYAENREISRSPARRDGGAGRAGKVEAVIP